MGQGAASDFKEASRELTGTLQDGLHCCGQTFTGRREKSTMDEIMLSLQLGSVYQLLFTTHMSPPCCVFIPLSGPTQSAYIRFSLTEDACIWRLR